MIVAAVAICLAVFALLWLVGRRGDGRGDPWHGGSGGGGANL